MNLSDIVCPTCHAAPIVLNDEEADIDPCEHLAFVYHTQADDFEYAAPLLRTQLPNDVMSDWNINSYEEILQNTGLLTQLHIQEVELEPYGHFGSRPWLVIGFYHENKTPT